MPMIGASLGDLDNASIKFRGSMQTAITTGTRVLFTTRGAVDAIKAETKKARLNCALSLTDVKLELFKAGSTLADAEYVGKNADVARQASGDIDQRAAQAREQVTAAFDEFELQITVLGEDLAEIAKSFDNYSANAADEREGMAIALKRQRENLASAMEGMTY